MRFSLGVAALLCFTTWMSVVHATHAPVSVVCCMQWSNTRVPRKRIVSYTIQSEGVCPIAAVMFQTKLGKTICSKPNSDWAIQAMLKVDKDKIKTLLEKRLNEDESTSDMTPAVSITSKNGAQKKTRNGRRRQRKGRGRKGQRKRV